MKFLLYAQAYSCGIRELPDAVDHTSFSVLRAFAGALGKFGNVQELSDPLQAEEIHLQCANAGEDCVLLSFAPPYLTPLLPTCPVIPVFAWEYPNIPERIEESGWQEDPRHDWRFVLAWTHGAIVLTSHARNAVRQSMGSDYPVAVIPFPVSGDIEALLRSRQPNNLKSAVLELRGCVADHLKMGIDVDAIVVDNDEDAVPFDLDDLIDLPPARYAAIRPTATVSENTSRARPQESDFNDPVPCGWELPPVVDIRTQLHGVVYTAALSPSRDRDNWEDLLTGFCWSFRDTMKATLILIIDDPAPDSCQLKLVMLLSKLSPFKCRVLAIYGTPEAAAYRNIIQATSYFVSTAVASGGCQQMVDFMAAGIPVIAPTHTGFADLVNEDVGFIVDSIPGIPRIWPHGDHDFYRTSWHQLNWQSLVDAFRKSHAVATREPARYTTMAARASQHSLTQSHADLVCTKVCQFLKDRQACAPTPPMWRDKRKTTIRSDSRDHDSNYLYQHIE
jgi:glycosyltransferase involved in cell wall biosynthesis